MVFDRFKQHLAIVVGINDYRNGVPRLETPVNDAQVLAEILEDQHRYEVILLLENEANRTALLDLLETQLPERLSDQGRCLFYFAGHGIALNGDDGPEGYLIPHDARLGEVSTYLSMTQVSKALLKLPCRHFLGILDCCFAGAFRWSSTRKLIPVEQGTIHKERFDRFIQDPAWQVITSAASDQYALDAFELKRANRHEQGKHSPFAATLIHALKEGSADAFPPAETGKPAGDGVITASELYLYLREQIEPETADRAMRQTPGIFPLTKHDKGEYIFLSPGHVLNLPPAPPLDRSSNPYRGLESFEETHKDLFFGRQALTQQLAKVVEARSLTVVLGASGSGKSSLVKAGLIPYLKNLSTEEVFSANLVQACILSGAILKGFPRYPLKLWPILSVHQYFILPPFRPGESPFKALNTVLESVNLSPMALSQAEDSTKLFPSTRLLDNWFQEHPHAHLLVVVDQLEELTTLCRDEQERQQFLAALAQAIAKHPNQLHLVLTLRSDFEAQFRNTPLETNWQAARFIVPAMTREELRQAIEEPASARVMYFDPHTLVERLIDEVANMPGALPLLSFALSELYLNYLKRQEAAKLRGETIDRAITQADYDELGGVASSLTQRAEREYDTLVQTDQAYEQTIRHVMLRMVAVGGELARRRVSFGELEYPEPENKRVQTAIQRFEAARLLTSGTDSDEQRYIEPAHDALVRGWARLLKWRQIDLGGLVLQRELYPRAEQWQREKQKKQSIGLLWNNDPKLPQLRQLLSNEHSWLNKAEIEFVQRSSQRKTNNQRRLVGFLTLVIAGLSGLTAWALVEQGNARSNAETAKQNENRANEQADLAKQNADEAQKQAGIATNNQKKAEANQKEAEKQAGIAKKNEARANEQADLAKRNSDEAQKQSGIALSNQKQAEASEREAKKQADLAQRNEKRASQQAILARKNADDAKRQAEIAVENQRQAEEQRNKAQDFLKRLCKALKGQVAAIKSGNGRDPLIYDAERDLHEMQQQCNAFQE